MKGKSRIRGPSEIKKKHRTNTLKFSLEKSIFVWNDSRFTIHDSRTGETNFGTPGKYVEPKGL